MTITREFIKDIKDERNGAYKLHLIENLYNELFDTHTPGQVFDDIKGGKLFPMSAADYSDVMVYYDEENDIIAYVNFGYGTVHIGWTDVLENINW